jgi:hypothetical protein
LYTIPTSKNKIALAHNKSKLAIWINVTILKNNSRWQNIWNTDGQGVCLVSDKRATSGFSTNDQTKLLEKRPKQYENGSRSRERKPLQNIQTTKKQRLREAHFVCQIQTCTQTYSRLDKHKKKRNAGIREKKTGEQWVGDTIWQQV